MLPDPRIGVSIVYRSPLIGGRVLYLKAGNRPLVNATSSQLQENPSPLTKGGYGVCQRTPAEGGF